MLNTQKLLEQGMGVARRFYCSAVLSPVGNVVSYTLGLSSPLVLTLRVATLNFCWSECVQNLYIRS